MYCLFPSKDKKISFVYLEYEKDFELEIDLEEFKKLENSEKAKLINKLDLYEDIYNFEKELCLKLIIV